MTSLQKRAREESSQVICVVGPAKHREGKEAGREPGVENIGVLLKFDFSLRHLEPGGSLALCLCFAPARDPVRLVCGVGICLPLDGDMVGGDPVTPPELPGDAPVPHPFHPEAPSLLVRLGDDVQRPCVHSFHSLGSHIITLDIPLGFYNRFDNILAPTANRHHHRIVLGLPVEPLLLQRLQHRLSCIKPLHPAELAAAGGDEAVVSEYGEEGQGVPLTTFVVIGVVGRGYLDGTGSKGHVDGDTISNDRDFAIGKRMDEHLANQVLISLVIWMNCHSGVSEHRLNPGGGDHKLLVAAIHLVGKADNNPKLNRLLISGNREQGPSSQLLLVDLNIRYGAPQCARPVDQPVASVDRAILVQPDVQI